MSGFDVVIGNPPFLNQLEAATTNERRIAAVISARSDGMMGSYTDTAATFLYLGASLLRDGGRMTLVQPQSILVTRDAAPVRRAVLESNSLTALWVSNEHVFAGASVFTCAPTLQRDGPRRVRVLRSCRGSFTALPPVDVDCDELIGAETWGPLAAAALGIPEINYRSSGVLSQIADATADFRDQYYGLDGFLVDDADLPADADRSQYPTIVTTGLVDLAQCHWGRTPTRILKRRWNAPRVDRRRMVLEGELGPWIGQRLVPKVILATQTKVIEVFVDERGEHIPSLPLITIVPHDSDLIWHVAACLASPVICAHSLRHFAGAALSFEAIKVSAKQVLALPTPEEGPAWDAAAAAIRAAHTASAREEQQRQLLEFAMLSMRAFQVPEDQVRIVFDWWSTRLLGPPSEIGVDDDDA